MELETFQIGGACDPLPHSQLEDSSRSLHNPVTGLCYPDEVPFFDRSGLVHYPVDGSGIEGAHLVLQTYDPRDHFRRRLTVHEIRLADFVAARGT